MTHESCCEEVRRMEDQVEGLKAEIDQLNVQLAGCSVVALGHSDKKNRMEPGDYGWSASYRDVLALRIAYETVKKKLRKADRMTSEQRTPPHGGGGGGRMNTRKIQKKYYLSEKVAKDSKILSAKVGITESRLVEHAIISELIREAKKGGGR